jgi:hypothetical protein
MPKLSWDDLENFLGTETELHAALAELLRSEPETFVELIDGNWILRETVEADPVRFMQLPNGQWSEHKTPETVH